MPPCPLLDKKITFSLKIMTLPKICNFWNVETPKPEKTDQADQIVQTDHLTGHATDQTLFTFSVDFFSRLPDLSFFTFSVIFSHLAYFFTFSVNFSHLALLFHI